MWIERNSTKGYHFSISTIDFGGNGHFKGSTIDLIATRSTANVETEGFVSTTKLCAVIARSFKDFEEFPSYW